MAKNENLNKDSKAKVEDHFLRNNSKLKDLKLTNLEAMEQAHQKASDEIEGTLIDNSQLANLEVPDLEKAEDHFLRNNSRLKDLEIPDPEERGKAEQAHKEVSDKAEETKSSFKQKRDAMMKRLSNRLTSGQVEGARKSAEQKTKEQPKTNDIDNNRN